MAAIVKSQYKRKPYPLVVLNVTVCSINSEALLFEGFFLINAS